MFIPIKPVLSWEMRQNAWDRGDQPPNHERFSQPPNNTGPLKSSNQAHCVAANQHPTDPRQQPIEPSSQLVICLRDEAPPARCYDTETSSLLPV